MLIRTPRKAKDFVTAKPHRSLTRRDFLKRGLATATMTALAPASALAATTCPPQVRKTGLLAQVMREGGPAVGAAFVHQIQATGMTATGAANYGLLSTSDLSQVGANWFVGLNSPFGIALLTPPAGYTQSAWNAVIKQSSLGGHFGPFGADDGAGVDLGHHGAAAAFKSSMLGKDLRIANGAAKAIWAEGMPSTNVSTSTDSLMPSSISGKFGMNPSSGITSTIMTNSATAADSLGSIFSSLLGINARKYGTSSLAAAVCGFYGDSVLADPNLGSSLFDPTKIAGLSATIQPAMLSVNEQALFASFYQSAIGSIGAVIIEQGGGDYHNDFDPVVYASSVAPNDYEAGRYVAMFLAACDAAKTPGALIFTANGNCGCNGVTPLTIVNTTINVQCPITSGGDSGGFFNAGTILCYSPTTPPVLKTTGTITASDGHVTPSTLVFSVPSGVAGLYLTALSYLGLDTAKAIAAMQTAGINNPTGLMLI
jgi:hypothetical protein